MRSQSGARELGYSMEFVEDFRTKEFRASSGKSPPGNLATRNDFDMKRQL
jgi:hypothetical protein